MIPTTSAQDTQRLADALAAFDRGAQLLERAYRELWASRETERGAGRLLASSRVTDLCHELRNPLGGVRGLCALLRREFGANASEKAARLLDRMEEGLAACDSILGRHAGGAEESCDAGSIAEETAGLALAENRAEGGLVQFRVDAPEGIELPVAAARFREVLANLVRNAAEACGAEGTVAVRVESAWDQVVAWVRDDGPGLPAVPDEILFRRGFSTKGTGRGRGLALAAELVEEAGGTLTFCRLAGGCLARVRLPRGR